MTFVLKRLQILQAGLESGLQRLGYGSLAMQDTQIIEANMKIEQKWTRQPCETGAQYKYAESKLYQYVLYWPLPNVKARLCLVTDRKMQAWQTLTKSHRRKTNKRTEKHRETSKIKQATQSNSCAWVKPVLMQTIDSFSASWSWTYILGSCSKSSSRVQHKGS